MVRVRERARQAVFVYFVAIWLCSLAVSADWTEVTNEAPWPPRYNHACVVFNDAIWVLGGTTPPGVEVGDIWYSYDGRNWTAVTDAAPWGPRAGHVFVFEDQMWVMGGHRGTHRLLDTWCSSDGESWSQVSESLAWGRRRFGSVVVHGEELWVIGTRESLDVSGCYTDVWHSPDGINWLELIPDEPWECRAGRELGFEDALWIVGGIVVPGGDDWLYFDDVWSSPDGLTWTEVTADAPWSGRSGHAVVGYSGDMWVVGGKCGDVFGDVWRSPDGSNWTSVTDAAPWRNRYLHACVAHDGKLWLLGGTEDVDGKGALSARNDVWCFEWFEFTETPSGGWKEEGAPLELRVGFEGAVGEVTYQWLKDGAPIADATTDRYCIASLQPEDGGYYVCAVTDETKATRQTPPAYVQVFAPGSLPAAHAWALAVATTLCILAGAFAVARASRP